MLPPRPSFPHEYDDLAPFISAASARLHHQNHQIAHIESLNSLVKGTKFELMSLPEIVAKSDGEIFLSAAEIWNHEFFWECIQPQKEARLSAPCDRLLCALENRFDTFHAFRSVFESFALSNSGAGWTWLVQEASGQLNIVNTSNAVTPLLDINSVPLLAIDVWEHAYYLDYLGDKQQYLDNFWAVVNWEFVDQRFVSSRKTK